MFYPFHVQPECYLNSFVLIPFLSCSNRSGSRAYLIHWAFSSYSSFLFSTQVFLTLFFFSLQLLFYLILFLYHLVPKILGRDLLLVEESWDTSSPMRQVSSSYSSSLPCHSLVCCILPCHHVHFIIMFFKTCIRLGFPAFSIIRFGIRHSHTHPLHLPDLVSWAG